MQPVSRNIIAAVVHRSTEGAASTLEAGAEGVSNSMETTITYTNGDTLRIPTAILTLVMRDGKGILRKANGDVYEGQFRGGMRHGEGKYTRADGREYDGEWSNNKKHGKGKMKFKDGLEYDGEYDAEWFSGLMHGKGKMKFNDGTEYDVVSNNGQLVLMHTLALRLKRSIEVIWHHLEVILVLGILMGLCAYWQM